MAQLEEDKMDVIKSKELKKIQLDILKYVASFCDKNGIKYWLTCGTLLGAVRHSGYIPWDDDIDIGMLRDDYNRFLSLFNDNAPTKYKLLDHTIQNDYFLPFGKVADLTTVLYEPDEKGLKLNVNIDIFIYDYAPQNHRKLLRAYKRCARLRDLNLLRNYSFSTTKCRIKRFLIKIIKFFISVFPKDFFVKRINSVAIKCGGKSKSFLGNFLSYTKIQCPTELIKSTVKIQFEDDFFFAPVDYDSWLKAFYGDKYMQLPPVEKRLSKHTFIAYYDNK